MVKKKSAENLPRKSAVKNLPSKSTAKIAPPKNAKFVEGSKSATKFVSRRHEQVAERLARGADQNADQKNDFAIDHSRRDKSFKNKKSTRNIVVVIAAAVLVVAFIASAKLFPRKTDDNGAKKSVQETSEKSERQDQTNQANRETSSSPNSPLEALKNQADKNLLATANIVSNSEFSSDSILKLAVPVYKQTFGQSCEAAALRMALEYRGVKTTDLEILEKIGFDNQPATKSADGQWTWGDPHKTYVGDKNGDQTKMTGYGVYAEPIATVAEKFGRGAEIANNVATSWIVNQIYAGNPVVLWGVSIKIADAKWTTPNGTEITAPMRTHTRLVVGVKGDPKNPAGFYINDPAYGQMQYWSSQKLTDNIAGGIRQAVAIF